MAKGLKQIELAVAADVTETQISDIERGANNPGWLLLTRVVEQGLELPMRDLGAAYDDQCRTQEFDANP